MGYNIPAMQQSIMEQIPTESTEPYPPRFWWLKRLTVCGIGLILLLVGLRIWWGYEAHKRLTAEIAAIQARGEPIFPEDFQMPAVADAENAAYYLKQAAAAISPLADSPSSTVMEYGSYFPYPPEWHAVADKAVTVNRGALDYARQARNYDKVDWGVKYSSPVINILLPHLYDQRHLANLLADAAIHAHLNDDDAAAMEYIRDILFIAQAVDQEPILVSHLVSIGIRALAIHRLQLIAPGLAIADDPSSATRPSIHPATREQVQAIISELLDEQPQHDARRRAFLAERMFLLDILKEMMKNSKVLRPMFELEAVRLIKMNNALLLAAKQFNRSAANAIVPSTPSPTTYQRFQLSQMTSTILALNFNRAILTELRSVVERRMTAVSLAARLYQIDHNGAWPPTLQALVPDYLPAVPVDPFAGDGRALGYILARGGTRPVVYCVADNGKDDTPDETILPPEPIYGWYSSRIVVDQWRDLSRWVPAPTTTPADGAASGEAGQQ